MKKICLSLALFLFLTMLSVASAADWKQVTTFSGAADQTTDYITIPTTEWRLVWSITPDNQYAGFYAYVYPKGENAIYVTSFDGDNKQTSGTIYVHEGAKDYYLKILAANLQGYSVKIEYDASAPIPEYTTPALIIMLIAITTGTVLIVKKKQGCTR